MCRCWSSWGHAARKVGQEALESSSAVLQTAAKPSQLPARRRLSAVELRKKKNPVSLTPGFEFFAESRAVSEAQKGRGHSLVPTGGALRFGYQIENRRFQEHRPAFRMGVNRTLATTLRNKTHERGRWFTENRKKDPGNRNWGVGENVNPSLSPTSEFLFPAAQNGFKSVKASRKRDHWRTANLRPTGFEPVTCSLGNCRSILLSYGRTRWGVHPPPLG